jgi:hypothetical protein
MYHCQAVVKAQARTKLGHRSRFILLLKNELIQNHKGLGYKSVTPTMNSYSSETLCLRFVQVVECEGTAA